MSKHIQHTKASFSYTFEYKWVSYRNLKLKSRGQQYRGEKKKKKKICKSNCFSDTLKNQGVSVWLIVGCFFGEGGGVVCWFGLLGFCFLFLQSLSSRVSQKGMNYQFYYFPFIPLLLFHCHQNASAVLLLSCIAHSCLTASSSALPQGQHRVHQEHSKTGL